MRVLRFLGVSLVCLVFGACAVGPRLTSSEKLIQQEHLKNEIFQSLQVRQKKIQSLRGLATVRFSSGLFGVRSEMAFALQKPGRFRLGSMAEMGLYASDIAIFDDQLTILWPGEHTYFEGPATPASMNRYLSLPWEPVDMIDLLSSSVPLEAQEHYRLKSRGHQRWLLQGEKSAFVVESFEGGFRPIAYKAYSENKRELYSIEFLNYALQDSVDFPRRLEITFYKPHSHVEIQFKEVDINPHLENKHFKINIPSEARRLEDNAIPIRN